MKILDLYPKDFYVTMELSLKEINFLLTALDRAELKFDGKNPQELAAVEFVKNQFFIILNRLYEENKQYVT